MAGWVDSIGNVLLKPQYDAIENASKGLYWVQVGGKANANGFLVGGHWGLVDSVGHVLLKPEYDALERVSKGLYRVNVGGKADILGRIVGGQWGLVDSVGKIGKVVKSKRLAPHYYPSQMVQTVKWEDGKKTEHHDSHGIEAAPEAKKKGGRKLDPNTGAVP